MRIVRRLLAFLIGWMAAIPAFFIAMAVFFGIAAQMSAQPGYWVAMAVSPVFLVSLPHLALFGIILAVVLTAVPVMALGLASEAFGWRSVWLFVVCGVGLAAWQYFVLTPRTLFGPADFTAMLEAGLFGLAGGVSGFVYWAIAGRCAGFRKVSEPAA